MFKPILQFTDTARGESAPRTVQTGIELIVAKDRNTKVLNAEQLVDNVVLVKEHNGSNKQNIINSRDLYLSKLPVEAVNAAPDVSIAESKNTSNAQQVQIDAATQALQDVYAENEAA